MGELGFRRRGMALTTRLAALTAVVLVPLTWWGWLAFVAPQGLLLPPGGAAWIVDSRWSVRKGTEELFPPTRFRVEWEAGDKPPAHLAIEVTALGRFRLAVNRRQRFDSATEARSSWKRPIRVDLGPWLEPGANEVLIEVRNEAGPTPLQVTVADGGSAVSTGTGAWEASARGLEWQPAALAGVEEGELQRGKLEVRNPLVHRGLLLAAAALTAAGLFGRRRAPPALKPAVGWFRRHGAAAGVFAVIAFGNLWNGLYYPYDASRIDWGGHVEHLRYAARSWRPALAEEGWQMYQPPLYYWVAASLVPKDQVEGAGRRILRRVQLFGVAVGVAHVALAWWLLTRWGPPSPRARALALAVVGLMPVALTMNAKITNEPFAGLACGLPLAAAALLLGRHPGPAAGVGLGLLSGLALLSKFTGLMPLAALAVVVAVHAVERQGRDRRRVAFALALLLLMAAAVAGPYYLRNISVYGKPFVGNWDPVSGQDYVQEPGYRTVGFFSRFGEVFFHHPERARWSSFWDGLYASAWGDIHGIHLGAVNGRAVALTQWVFALALVPTVGALAGFLAAAVRSVSRAGADVDLLMVTVSVFSLVAVAAFALEVPFYSTVNARFLLNLTLPTAYFAAWGYSRMESHLGRGRFALDLAGAAMAALILYIHLWRA